MSAAVPGALARLADPIVARAGELGAEGAVEAALARPSIEAHGDFATAIAMRLAPALGRSPREIAEELAEGVPLGGLIESVDVAGPGFLNLHVTPAWYGLALAEVLDRGEAYGSGSAAEPEHIQVELVSANPTGPLTVGSARNGAYGDSVARLLAFAGHRVEREYYYNDAGSQIERFRASVEARRRGEEPPEDGYHGDYITEVAQLDGDPVPTMLEQIEATLRRFRIEIDTWERQSKLERDVPAIIDRLETYEAAGALWIRSTAHGDEKDRVLVRSADRGGLPTYEAADAVYMQRKLAVGFDRLVYVLGADHHSYVAWLGALASALGTDPARVEVLIYQLVHVTEQGEAKKVSKRRGDVVLLDELLDEVGVDAARWFLVARGHDQTVDIDVDLAREKTQKNPVYYVQYGHARIAGILRNAGAAEISPEPPAELAPAERDLVKRLVDFTSVVAEATEHRGPHAIPIYAVRLADDFHRFYQRHRVLDGAAQAFRLALCLATQRLIARCLDLIGVEAPERM
ncbi:MAG: arginine--tRNA ligase [Actinomycetia bacterium]|nr:arginine--tRNA ligase [Actinomycetes bacterium]